MLSIRSGAELLILFWTLFLYSCGAPKSSVKENSIISFDKFKKQHLLRSDQECLESIINCLHPHTDITILFEPKTYRFSSTIVLDNLNTHIEWKGQPGTVWNLGVTFLKSTALKFEYPLNREIKRGDKQIDLLENASRLGLIEFYSSDTVESAWYYRANDLMAVREVKDGQIFFHSV